MLNRGCIFFSFNFQVFRLVGQWAPYSDLLPRCVLIIPTPFHLGSYGSLEYPICIKKEISRVITSFKNFTCLVERQILYAKQWWQNQGERWEVHPRTVLEERKARTLTDHFWQSKARYPIQLRVINLTDLFFTERSEGWKYHAVKIN